MTYVNELDPLTPTDLDPAHQGDDEIRKVKAALIERLETVFEDIDEDPLNPKIEVFGKPFYAGYNADALVGSHISAFGRAEKILALRVQGTTDENGELDVLMGAFSDETGTSFSMSNCIAILAQARAPDDNAVSPNHAVVRDDGSNMFTLRVQDETEHSVEWFVLMAFSA